MTTAIILAAGRGTRMKTSVPKQFLDLGGEPMFMKSLRVFEESDVIDEIFLVTSEEYVEYCRQVIAKAGKFRKVRDVIIGGERRSDSVYNALLACEGTDYVMIHDGARPYVTEAILERTDRAVRVYSAAAVGVPSKDTVKIADNDGFAASTPDRSRVWLIQTPQAFSYKLIREANDLLRAEGRMDSVTDDAMIVEASGLARVKLVEGAYSNIKITTEEDMPKRHFSDKFHI